MLRGELEDLITHLTGDEHTWVDFKQDYPIDYERDNSARADFLQDIAAMANTINTEPSLNLRYLGKKERYILVGVDDNGNVVGASDELGEYTSILEVDLSEPQNLIADYLSPSPHIEIHTYDEQDPKLALLIIKTTTSPPVTIDGNIENLNEGEVYIRDGDRNRPATRDDYQDFIQFHLEKERDYVTDGLRQMVGMDIDFLRDLGRLEEIDEEEEEAMFPVRLTDEEENGSLEVLASLNSPLNLTSLARELNADITKWRRRPNYACSPAELYDYYQASDSLEPNEEKLGFLAQASWRHGMIGSYWVFRMGDYEAFIETFRRIDMGSFKGEMALYLGKFLAVTMREEVVEEFVDFADMNTSYSQGYGSIVLRCARESNPDEVLSSQSAHRAEYIDTSSWHLEDMDQEELFRVVRQVADELGRLTEETPEVTPSGLKGWLRNAEIYLADGFLSIDEGIENEILKILDN